ncbi:MAG: 16S rRNA (guanine(966)-N(2))-methyltransferase RsmD [Alphaproteobacteria bacterium 16-39-46]|nr:MAG: 16S rRNA (guanine(966)-N(2))-methyltransferase RsmD [Alphaproteobacteria bacterium 16-39-46]OZA42868.1 MAG: 16S rRNA (guanine(966)-N(2))-methyltransferase RsmD [Alphaproteobacteria bacterium 17-39-52]HQS84256.1 16S rRNA (guanine(966)-N(2))-methyltransferase RsmD [Alphaproteobacteria bacterium]HQS94092.1 16S rRNA (guanine(966)-N(2))-methyltransferase RsmD [Alphaproteobacteria bacterium]
MLRIIGGSLRGRPLDFPPSSITRPTSDRGREAVFNILEHRFRRQDGISFLKDAVVLDLFAGSGAFGLECLSRGSSFCLFVENNPEALSVLNANRKSLNFLEKSTILNGDALKPFDLPSSFKEKMFDLIFLDPPYTKGYVLKALMVGFPKKYVSSKTLIIAELDVTEELDEIQEYFTVLEERLYGRAKFLFGHLKP